jgi:FMN-dependent NADH-azoreductase
LHDLSFFSIEGTGAGPDAVAATRIETEHALQAHFTASVLPS